MLRGRMLRFARVGGARRPHELAVPDRTLRWGVPRDEPELADLDSELAEVVDPDELSDFEKSKARDLAFKLRAFTERAIASKVRTDPDLARKSPEMRHKLANLIAVLGTLDEHGLELDPENAEEVVQGLGESYSWASAFRFLRTMAKSPDMEVSDELCGSLIRNLYDEGCYDYVKELVGLAQELNVTVGVHTRNALISVLARQRSSLPTAHALLHRLRESGEANAASYDALTRGLIRLGNMDDALQVLRLCELDGKPQTEVGYNSHDFWAWVLLEARRLRVTSSTVQGRYFSLADARPHAPPSIRDMAIYAWAGDFWGAAGVYGELLKGPRTVQLLNTAMAMYLRFEMAQLGLRQLLDADRHGLTHNNMTTHLISTARDCLRPRDHEAHADILSRPTTAPSAAAKYAHALLSAQGSQLGLGVAGPES